MAKIDETKFQISTCGKYMEIKPNVLPTYRESVKRQLHLWLHGISEHNTFWDECCPDWSCCGGKLWDLSLRQKFVKAVEQNNEELIMQMCIMSLGNAVEEAGLSDEVYIAGDAESKEKIQ